MITTNCIRCRVLCQTLSPIVASLRRPPPRPVPQPFHTNLRAIHRFRHEYQNSIQSIALYLLSNKKQFQSKDYKSQNAMRIWEFIFNANVFTITNANQICFASMLDLRLVRNQNNWYYMAFNRKLLIVSHCMTIMSTIDSYRLG